ncbi:hypothetical protein skT53_20860 [Effusibacillus dendaii]|uniref:Uncharacterized protein n=1 Tax=Effusibacillus dendaii TaxID=2743772 RepID=A0A7I8DH24_9BACL|nr:hypothetical protein skT53_20860 [Effusibacillus dendaii]
MSELAGLAEIEPPRLGKREQTRLVERERMGLVKEEGEPGVAK